MAYGAALSRDEFPTLVRTYFVTQRAIAAIPDGNLQAQLHLAYRSQTLREAIEEFLKTDSTPVFHCSSVSATAEVGGS